MMMRWIVKLFLLCYVVHVMGASLYKPHDITVKQGKTLASALEKFHLDSSHKYPDAPYFDDARPSPPEYYDPPVPKCVQKYNAMIRCSDGSYLLFGQGKNILQLLLNKDKLYAMQLSCAMHCKLSTDLNETFQVYVKQGGKMTQIVKNGRMIKPFEYASVAPLTIAVNLGDMAAKDKPWQYVQITYDMKTDLYKVYYWRRS